MGKMGCAGSSETVAMESRLGLENLNNDVQSESVWR